MIHKNQIVRRDFEVLFWMINKIYHFKNRIDCPVNKLTSKPLAKKTVQNYRSEIKSYKKEVQNCWEEIKKDKIFNDEVLYLAEIVLHRKDERARLLVDLIMAAFDNFALNCLRPN